ncbi:MAG: helix-turn-helix domain-containing protein [Pirellulales bacterium]|nr:helix-turn-helix domain-containing protein [Pirellulales bacterium]
MKRTAETMVSPAGMRIIRLLIGRAPQSVADLVKAVGVTRTAITEQLDELEEAGFVERTVERLSGRGRPRNRFRATQAALRLLDSGRECLIGQAIWRAVREVGGDSFVKKILNQVSIELANHYNRLVTAKTPAGRLRQMNKILTNKGLLVEFVDEGSHVSIKKRSCEFISLFEGTRSVCYIDEKVMTLVVGHPVRKVACRHDGDPCCIFEIDKKAR